MPPGEHVNIISAGENIHTAYPAIFRILPTITRTYVLADNSVYELSSNPEVEKGRAATREAVAAVKEISASLSIPFSHELIYQPMYPSVRDTVIKIHHGCPERDLRSTSRAGQNPSATHFLQSHPGWRGMCILPLIRGPREASRSQSVLCGPCLPIPTTR